MRKTVLKPLIRSTLCLLALGIASPALALDPQPKTYREKQRHEFRDVQRGLIHPAPHGRSTPTKPTQTSKGQSAPRTMEASR